MQSFILSENEQKCYNYNFNFNKTSSYIMWICFAKYVLEELVSEVRSLAAFFFQSGKCDIRKEDLEKKKSFASHYLLIANMSIELFL